MKIQVFFIYFALNLSLIFPQSIPELKKPVMDLVGILKPSEISSLENLILNLQKEKGSQIGVLIVESTLPYSIEEYSIKVAEQWKLGRKGVDDGVLFLIAIKDRKMRIEVGYGLEGAIPDAKAKQILDDYVKPYFKKGDYYNGIYSGIGMLEKLIRGESLPESENFQQKDKSFELIFQSVFAGIALIFHIIAILFNFIHSKVRGFISLYLDLSLIVLLSIFLPAYLAIFFSAFIIWFFAIFTAVIFNAKKNKVWYDSSYSGNSGNTDWGSSYNSYSNSSWSSNGFSGGGGSFGGGGASSSW